MTKLGTILEYLVHMLKKHLNFIVVFILLALGLQVRNQYFSPKSHQSLVAQINKPNSALMGVAKLPPKVAKSLSPKDAAKAIDSKGLNPSDLHLDEAQALSEEDEVEHIVISKLASIKKETSSSLDDQVAYNIASEKNEFTKTYQKFANLEFSKGEKKQYLLDLKNYKADFLSLGFTVDKGEILSPEVTVQYANGDSEVLTLPYDQMFINDWIKLNVKENMAIHSLLVSAQSSQANSVFSFFVQNQL